MNIPTGSQQPRLILRENSSNSDQNNRYTNTQSGKITEQFKANLKRQLQENLDSKVANSEYFQHYRILPIDGDVNFKLCRKTVSPMMIYSSTWLPNVSRAN